ncbi:hypothetical protein [Kaarinaea lacus]
MKSTCKEKTAESKAHHQAVLLVAALLSIFRPLAAFISGSYPPGFSPTSPLVISLVFPLVLDKQSCNPVFHVEQMSKPAVNAVLSPHLRNVIAHGK